MRDGIIVLSVIVPLLTNDLETARKDSAAVDRGDPSPYLTAVFFIPESESVLIFATLILMTHPPLDFCTVIVHEIILKKSIGPTNSISDKKA